MEKQKTKSKLITLEGRTLTSADNSSRVAQWGLRVKNRESEENIIKKNGLMVSTMKADIKSRRHYFDICEKNGSAPEGAANV